MTLVDGNVSSNPSSDNDLDDVDESVEKEKVACAVPLLVKLKNRSISDFLSYEGNRRNILLHFGEQELVFIIENLYGLNSKLPSERKKIYDNCVISFSVAVDEWCNLRAYLVANRPGFPVKNVTDTLQFIINRESEYPIMTRLAHIPVVGATSTGCRC